jgi:hypothetical protein
MRRRLELMHVALTVLDRTDLKGRSEERALAEAIHNAVNAAGKA